MIHYLCYLGIWAFCLCHKHFVVTYFVIIFFSSSPYFLIQVVSFSKSFLPFSNSSTMCQSNLLQLNPIWLHHFLRYMFGRNRCTFSSAIYRFIPSLEYASLVDLTCSSPMWSLSAVQSADSTFHVWNTYISFLVMFWILIFFHAVIYRWTTQMTY